MQKIEQNNLKNSIKTDEIEKVVKDIENQLKEHDLLMRKSGIIEENYPQDLICPGCGKHIRNSKSPYCPYCNQNISTKYFH